MKILAFFICFISGRINIKKICYNLAMVSLLTGKIVEISARYVLMLIAEVKTKSPFGYAARQSWDELFAVAEKTGDIISIHTDPRWGGSFDLVKKARALTKKPILAKGIHAEDGDITKALAAGADLVLVVGRIPPATVIDLSRCLLEPISFEQLKSWAADPALAASFAEKSDATCAKIVWNSRDLATGRAKKESFKEARAVFPGWLCQASHIRSVSDVDPTANAVLVGTHLAEFAASIEKIQ
jgi:indole-3-glycerol phosphate synthase